jgi:hypothetical protein
MLWAESDDNDTYVIVVCISQESAIVIGGEAIHVA